MSTFVHLRLAFQVYIGVVYWFIIPAHPHTLVLESSWEFKLRSIWLYKSSLRPLNELLEVHIDLIPRCDPIFHLVLLPLS